MNSQKGFTLIELVVVIVILGILAATALPKFVDLSGDAGNAAANGAAGALASATAMNYARYQINSTSASAVKEGTTCDSLRFLMAGEAWPESITADGTLGATCIAGAVDTTTCKLKHTKGSTSATVAVTCTG